jgi:hypothetical protein
MSPDTNRGPSVAGGWARLGGRKLAGGRCRDEVVTALRTLQAQTGTDVFTVRDVYAEMAQAGTRYAESTVFKTMQRLKAPPERPPYIRLERAGQEGFQVALGQVSRSARRGRQ